MAAHSTGSTGSSRSASSSRDRHGPPIPSTQLRQILNAACTPVKSCPKCDQKLGCWISWTDEHLAMRFYKCNVQVKGVTCGFFEWIDHQHSDYVKLVLSSLRDAVRLSKEQNALWKHVEELRYKDQLENTTFHKLEEQLENKTREIQKLEEQLENKTGKIQKLEEQLENKARGRWFSMVFWFLSMCFALFVGGAMEHNIS